MGAVVYDIESLVESRGSQRVRCQCLSGAFTIDEVKRKVSEVVKDVLHGIAAKALADGTGKLLGLWSLGNPREKRGLVVHVSCSFLGGTTGDGSSRPAINSLMIVFKFPTGWAGDGAGAICHRVACWFLASGAQTRVRVLALCALISQCGLA